MACLERRRNHQAAWQELLKQLQDSFTAVAERMRRSEAEAALELSKMLEQAKQAALKAFDEDGLLRWLEQQGLTDHAQAKAAADKAYSVRSLPCGVHK
jgi:DNA-binding ferritin-like protein